MEKPVSDPRVSFICDLVITSCFPDIIQGQTVGRNEQDKT